MRGLLEVPRRFGKRDGNALCILSFKLEKERCGQQKFGDKGRSFGGTRALGFIVATRSRGGI